MRASSRPQFHTPLTGQRCSHWSVLSTTWTVLSACMLLSPAPSWAQQPAPAPAAADTSTWTTFKGSNQRTGASTATVPLPLNLLWRFSSDEDARTFKTSPLVLGAPGRQRVYFAAGRSVYAVDAQTGERAWANNVRLSSAAVTPLTHLSTESGDYLLVAQQGGRIAAIRTADGGRAWEVDARSSITSAGPIVVETTRGPRIIAAVNAGRLVAFTTSGDLDPDWEVKLGRFGTNPSSSMSVNSTGSLLYLTGSDAKLYAIDVNKGVLAYTVQLPAQSTVTPIVAEDQVIVSTSRLVQGLQASGGNQVWSMNPRSEVLATPAAGRTQNMPSAFFGTASGLFYSVSRQDGRILWRTDLEAAISGSPVFLPNMVLVGTRNGILVAMNPNDGAVLWRYRLRTERLPVITPTIPGGGGFAPPPAPGGEEGAPGPDGTAADERIWGVSSGPAVVNGRVYLLADNAAMYGFTTSLVDANEPLAVEPSLALPDETNKITSLLLTPDTPLIVPGRGPMYLAVQMDDTGSGVDPKSIQVSLDGTPLPAAAISFRVDSGVLTATLLNPDAGAASFPDGLKNLELKVRDYVGNELTYTASFLVDNSVPPPAAPAETPDGGGAPAGGGDFGGAPME